MTVADRDITRQITHVWEPEARSLAPRLLLIRTNSAFPASGDRSLCSVGVG
jgi:hypothetical protein